MKRRREETLSAKGHQNRLYRYLLRLVRQPAEAEDLFQQTWLRAVEKIRSFDARRNFDAWLFTLARNLAIDHLRRIRPQSLDEPLANSWHSETVTDRISCKDNTPARSRARGRAPNGDQRSVGGAADDVSRSPHTAV